MVGVEAMNNDLQTAREWSTKDPRHMDVYELRDWLDHNPVSYLVDEMERLQAQVEQLDIIRKAASRLWACINPWSVPLHVAEANEDLLKCLAAYDKPYLGGDRSV